MAFISSCLRDKVQSAAWRGHLAKDLERAPMGGDGH